MEASTTHGNKVGNAKSTKTIKIDFNKLERHALMKLLKHYNANPKVGATHSELASMATKAFDQALVSEMEVVSKFSRNISSTGAEDPAAKRPKYSRHYLDSEPARTGEQVAAKVSKSNENGSWILGNVLEYDAPNSVYIVQDEDDTSRTMKYDVIYK
jgi:SAGA-associated factor 29